MMAAVFIRRMLNHLGMFKQDVNKQRIGKDNSVNAAVPTVHRVRDSPVVTQCIPGTGGVQGLTWYTENLQMDEDGDVAQEFLDEVTTQTPHSDDPRKFPRFEVKLRTQPVKPKGPICTLNGNVYQCVETSGGVKWG